MRETSTVPSRTSHSSLGSSIAMHLLALAFVVVATAVAAVLERHVGLREPSLVFLAGVLLTAVLGGLAPSLTASVASVLSYNYYFTEPYRTFKVHDPQDVVSLVVFLMVAVLTSHQTARIRSQSAASQAREARTSALYAFTRELSAQATLDGVLSIVCRHIGTQFQADVLVLLSDKGVLKPRASSAPELALPEWEREAAAFAWSEGRSATMAVRNAAGESGTADASGAVTGQWVHISLGTIRGEVAVLSLRFAEEPHFSRDDEQLLDAFTQQAGVALERCLLEAPPQAGAGSRLRAGD